MIHPQPKPEPRKRVKGRQKRAQRKDTAAIRQYVFARERDICRCCRKRKAMSLHEIIPRGRGGRISKRNSIAVCGSLVGTEECCHTYLQQPYIVVYRSNEGAEGWLGFAPMSERAADWIGIPLGDTLISPPMQQMEDVE